MLFVSVERGRKRSRNKSELRGYSPENLKAYVAYVDRLDRYIEKEQVLWRFQNFQRYTLFLLDQNRSHCARRCRSRWSLKAVRVRECENVMCNSLRA